MEHIKCTSVSHDSKYCKTYAIIMLGFLCVCCSNKHESGRLGSTVELFAESFENIPLIDTVICFIRPPKLSRPDNYWMYGTDTIIRFGPYKFGSRSSIVAATISQGAVKEYSLIFTDFMKSIRPLPSTILYDLSDDYSKKDDYTFLADSLHRVMGNPTFSSDTVVQWHNHGATLKAYNNFTTIILTYSNPTIEPYSLHDWELCALIADSVILSLNTGVKKDLSVISMRDTVLPSPGFLDTVSHRITQFRMFGMPGEMMLLADRENNIVSYGWEAQSTGDRKSQSLYVTLATMLRELVSKDYPHESIIDRDVTSEINWTNGRETVYLWYYKELPTITVGRAQNIYMDRLHSVEE